LETTKKQPQAGSRPILAGGSAWPPPTSVEGSFFSVASTTPFTALMPKEVAPLCTAASACLICTNSPEELNVVRE